MTKLEVLAGAVAASGGLVTGATGSGAYGVIGAFVFAFAFAPRMARMLG